jgi:23S rRNA pseudouridine1911/1915/1917 synthase
VHLAGIGHPILGDASYGSGDDDMPGRPMLHAGVLGFAHPTTGEYQEHAAPLPPDMADAVAARRTATCP